MNKAMRKVLALGIAVMMLLGTATAFAADGLEVSEQTGPADKAADLQMPGRAVSNQAFGKLPSEEKTIKTDGWVKAMTVSSVTALGTVYADSEDSYAKLRLSGGSNYEVWFVKPGASGKLWFNAGVYANSDGAASIVFGTYNSTSKTITTLTNVKTIEPGNGYSKMGCVDVKANTTYCFAIYSEQPGYAGVFAYVFPYAERTLTNGTWMISSGARGSSNAVSTVTYKVIAPKTGYMDVYLDAAGRSANTVGKVTLLNKSRRVVSSTLSFNKASKTGYAVFGVKKGAMYYIKVAGCTGTAAEQFVYGVKYKVTAGKKRSNTKRSRSITLKRKGKAVKTVIPANGKSGKGWYKFKVTKKRKTQIRVNATNVKSGSLKLTVYCGKKKVATAKVVKGKINTFTVTHSTTWGKAKRGTYYAVITKSAKANGQYSVKFLR